MKKFAFWAALALLVCLAVPGLAQLPLSLDMTPDEVWAEMVAVNDIDALIADAGSLKSETVSLDENGEATYTLSYDIDSEHIVMNDSDGNTQVATAEGDIYGYDSEAGAYFIVVTPHDLRGTLHDVYTASILFDWSNETEHIAAMEALDDELVVTTYVEDMNLYCRYHLDPATARISRCDEYIEGEGQPVVATATIFYGAPVGELDEQLYEATHGEDRSVTLVFDPGTEEESTFTTVVKEGIEVVVLDGVYEGYEHHFADPECTEPVYGEITEGDVTFYMKKGL